MRLEIVDVLDITADNITRTMIEDCDIRICAGGKEKGYKGKMPGVLEEILIAGELGKPLYLLGGFGGIVHSICEIRQKRCVPDQLTLEWQVENNIGYRGLLECYKRNGEDILYTDIVKKLKKLD